MVLITVASSEKEIFEVRVGLKLSHKFSLIHGYDFE
jgi:hypothetical protein